MSLSKKKYDFQKVSALIKKDDVKKAMHYMMEYTESRKLTSANFELEGCSNRLKKNEDDYNRDLIQYGTYIRHRNKIIYYLMHLNVEIKSIDEAKRYKRLIQKLRNMFRVFLIVLPLVLIPFCFSKTIVQHLPEEKKNVDIVTKPPYEISKFYVNHFPCSDSINLVFKIKNISNHNLKSIQFVWTPNSLSQFSEKSEMITLKIDETKWVEISIDNQHKLKPGIYHSSLEEIHPVSANRKFDQNFKIAPCEK